MIWYYVFNAFLYHNLHAYMEKYMKISTGKFYTDTQIYCGGKQVFSLFQVNIPFYHLGLTYYSPVLPFYTPWKQKKT